MDGNIRATAIGRRAGLHISITDEPALVRYTRWETLSPSSWQSEIAVQSVASISHATGVDYRRAETPCRVSITNFQWTQIRCYDTPSFQRLIVCRTLNGNGGFLPLAFPALMPAASREAGGLQGRAARAGALATDPADARPALAAPM
jgi:hypothetical protein